MLNIKLISILIISNFLLVFYYSKISRLINIYDKPDYKRKIHKYKTPLLGGLIFFVNLVIYIFLLAINYIPIENIFFNNKDEFIFFILVAFVLFIIGLYDDKKQLSPNIKLLSVLFCISSLMMFNEEILITEVHFSFINKVCISTQKSFKSSYCHFGIYCISKNQLSCFFITSSKTSVNKLIVFIEHFK